MKLGPLRIRLPWPRWRGWSFLLGRERFNTHQPFTIPVLVIRYLPVRGDRVDIDVTGTVGGLVDEVRQHTVDATAQVIDALQRGSAYHAYKDPGVQPCLRYDVVGTIEFLEPLPTYHKPDHQAPMTDYTAIMERVDIRQWVEGQGVEEVWLWGYHGGRVDLWESNMAGPYGDVSNSDCDPHDLPVLSKTYTLYHYNYERGASEAVENHIHQFESLFNHLDGRHYAPPERWPEMLFWGRFVGSDDTFTIVHPGCGWAHYPPNGEQDYDWDNTRYVWTDIEDWHPDGSGEKQRMNCTRWNCNSLDWFVYWMQSLPGKDNGLTFGGRSLTNWWAFVGDFDACMDAGLGLVE